MLQAMRLRHDVFSMYSRVLDLSPYLSNTSQAMYQPLSDA
jgi:hypothetical protein